MMTYILVAVGVAIGAVLLLAFRPKPNTAGNATATTETIVKKGQQDTNPYEGLRSMALGVKAEQLGIQFPDQQTTVFGIVMDWDMGSSVATVVAYKTGDASMYLNTGGGVIGGGKHDNVKTSVGPYILMGQNFLDKAKKTQTTPLPDKDCVRFYFLTNNGTYYAQETMTKIEKGSSAWLPLFEEANKVLAQLRLITEKK